MTRPDPTNHQAADRAASLLKGANVSRIEELEAERDALERYYVALLCQIEHERGSNRPNEERA